MKVANKTSEFIQLAWFIQMLIWCSYNFYCCHNFGTPHLHICNVYTDSKVQQAWTKQAVQKVLWYNERQHNQMPNLKYDEPGSNSRTFSWAEYLRCCLRKLLYQRLLGVGSPCGEWQNQLSVVFHPVSCALTPINFTFTYMSLKLMLWPKRT